MTTPSRDSTKRGPAPESESQLPKTKRRIARRRAALACEECRGRKRRCDGAIPACSGCIKRMSTCIYSSEIQARSWNSDHPSPSWPPERGSSTTNSPVSGPWVFNDQASLARRNEASSPGGQYNRFEQLMKSIDAVIDRKSGSADHGPTGTVEGIPGSMEALPTTLCTCDQALETTTWCLPLRRHADRLISRYFRTVHLVYPLLHEQTFRRQYEQVWEPAPSKRMTVCSGLCRQKSHGQLFLATVHAVFALASIFEPGLPDHKAARADGFFRLAEKIDLLDILDDEVGIELVQLGLLMGFYLQSTERFSKCWNIAALTIRMAHNMGLQLNPTEARKRGLLATTATQFECEMRVRVWYGCFLLDREISMSFGRPLIIATGENHIRLPDAIDDDRLSDEVGKWNTQPKEVPSLLESYIQTIKLYRILSEVLDWDRLKEKTSLTCPSSEVSSEEISNTRAVVGLDTKIMEWREALPPYLQYDPSVNNISTPEALTSGGGVTAPITYFVAQATRLHTRFLHTRLLILRPVLERLFERQQHPRSIPTTQAIEARLEDMMLSNIAAQCVVCADRLVKVLEAQIKLQTFVAWWYNISYLHTCGSTILMGQLCTFGDASRPDESLVDSWNRCLQCLSHNSVLNNTAKQSFHLLQESAKRLLSNYPETHRQEPPSADELQHGGNMAHMHSLHVGEKSYLGVDNPAVPLLDRDGEMLLNKIPIQSDLLVDPRMTDRIEGFDGELLNAHLGGTTYWPFISGLSQLDALSSNFDPSHIGP